jgi:hypothetical protein
MGIGSILEAETMSRTYNFAQSQKLLRVDAKTFGKWLEKAKIDPETLRDSYDTRQKLLTYEQIVLLADLHKRPRPPLPEEDIPEPPAAVILTTVDERLAALEQLIIQRFDGLQRELAEMAQQITATPGNQVEVKTSAAPIAPVASSTRKPTKKTARGKRLPRNLVPLYVFRNAHGVSAKAAEHAMEKGKFTVERGRWTYNNRNVMIALGKLGQHEFYTVFHERENFQRCEQCPHTL